MSGTLVVAEHRRGRLRDVTFELVTAARELEPPVRVAVIGHEPASLVDQANVEGVDEIVTVSVEPEEFENDVYRHAVEALIGKVEPSVVLMGFTVDSVGYGPALAAKLRLGYASDVFAVAAEDGRIVAVRAFYGGKVNAELDFRDRSIVLLLLRPTVWTPASGEGGALVREVRVESGPSRARHLKFVHPPAADVDITTADVILAIGRGVGERENVKLFAQLADKMGATLAASRPLIDAGWLPPSRQVGQSGNTVKPKVYLAFGISGAVQHLVGMKGSGTIVAVNVDREAAIFNVADYGAVADLFEVAQELEKLF